MKHWVQTTQLVVIACLPPAVHCVTASHVLIDADARTASLSLPGCVSVTGPVLSVPTEAYRPRMHACMHTDCHPKPAVVPPGHFWPVGGSVTICAAGGYRTGWTRGNSAACTPCGAGISAAPNTALAVHSLDGTTSTLMVSGSSDACCELPQHTICGAALCTHQQHGPT